MLTTDVIEHFGGKKISVAKALGLNKSTISLWGQRVPKGVAAELHVLTDGKLTFNPSDYKKDAA